MEGYLTQNKRSKIYFIAKEGLEIKKQKGVICEVMPLNHQKHGRI